MMVALFQQLVLLSLHHTVTGLVSFERNMSEQVEGGLRRVDWYCQ